MSRKLFFLLCMFLIVSLFLPLYVQEVNPEEAVMGSSFGNPAIPEGANWTRFWKIFNAHSDWDLEYNNGSGWISRKADLQIIKNYSRIVNLLNFTQIREYNVNKTEASACKITLNFTATYQADYRLTFGIDLDVKNYTHREGSWNYTLSYQNHSVVFDWSDIKDLPLDYVGHGIKEVEGEDWFWFRIRKNNIPQGYNVIIDPSFGHEETEVDSQPAGNFINVCRFQMDAVDGIGDNMSVYVDSTGSTNYIALGIYDDSYNLITNTTQTLVPQQDNQWVLCDFSDGDEPSLTASTWYRLGMWFDDGMSYHYETGVTNQARRLGRDYDALFPDWADTITGTLDSARQISIYMNYTVEAGEAYVSDLSQSVTTAWSVLTEWDAIADFSQSVATSWSVLTEWDAVLDVTQALTTSWNVLANLNTFVDLSQAIGTTWTILIGWDAILDFSQSLTTSWQVLTQSTFNVILPLSTTFVWIVVIGLQYILDFSQTISTSWNILIGWDAIADFTQSLTTSWTVLTQTSFNIIASLSNTFTWLVDIIHTVGGVAYIADLSQAIATTWNVLTQWNSIVDLSQALSTTWTVLIQSTFNIVTSLSNTFTWTVDVLKGVITDHIVDLSLSVVTSWIIDVIHTPWTTIYATKGFVLATIMLGLLIGTPLLAIIIWRKTR